MQTLAILFEFIPVILAIVAIPSLLVIYARTQHKVTIILATVSCVLLIIAQTGWMQAYLLRHDIAMTLFDKIWTLFNSLVMLTYILWSKE